MKKVKGKRASGGNSWADAMFRMNADTKTYIRGMLERVVCKCSLAEDKFAIRYPIFSRFDYLILHNNNMIIRGRFEAVEEHRRRSAFSYEIWLKEQITMRLEIEINR